jgi:hypothetical protein
MCEQPKSQPEIINTIYIEHNTNINIHCELVVKAVNVLYTANGDISAGSNWDYVWSQIEEVLGIKQHV